MTGCYPFAALVGQDELKRALLLCAVNPAVGGVLIRGEKGTAKSTAVRGLAELLPEIQVIRGCAFSLEPSGECQEACTVCNRCRNGHEAAVDRRRVQVINLPLNATEDRVAGGIDFTATVRTGSTVLQPGLLAQAHRGILYVDEVNLLDDHIVDLVLDAAASGMNIIEREGISLSHPSEFTLIGTMNPEEGELRPQFLDRFGLCVEVQACQDIADRVRLVEQRERFDSNPAGFMEEFREETQRLRQTISDACRKLALVHVDSTVRSFIANLCVENHVAGHRADLIMEQAARAVAALEGDSRVTSRHVREIAPLVLAHRLRDASPPPPSDRPGQEDSTDMDREQERQDRTQEGDDGDTSDNRESAPESEPQGKNESDPPAYDPDHKGNEENRVETDGKVAQDTEDEGGSESGDQVFDIGPQFRVRRFSASRDRVVRRGSGRRSRSRVSQKQGRYTRAGLNGVPGDIALDATIRAAAPFQKSRGGRLMINLCPDDFRYRIRERRIGNLLLFIVDASGSMGARGRMAATKGAVMSLLLDAYQKRDKVAMVSFRRDSAWLNLPVTGSVELAGKLLAEMPVGGRTPLSAGLAKGYEQMRNYFSKEPEARPIVIIITDGKCNVSIGKERPVDEMVKMASAMGMEKRATYIVVDTEEEGIVTFDLASRLAAALGGSYFKIKDLQAEELVHIVRGNQIR